MGDKLTLEGITEVFRNAGHSIEVFDMSDKIERPKDLDEWVSYWEGIEEANSWSAVFSDLVRTARYAKQVEAEKAELEARIKATRNLVSLTEMTRGDRDRIFVSLRGEDSE